MSSKIYTLGYTGPEVDEAIEKIQNLDITSLSGGIIELESTSATPYNLDFLRSPGLYKAAFVYDVTAPSAAAAVSPVYIYVSSVDSNGQPQLIQSLYAGTATYTRISTDRGMTWEIWETADGLSSATEITSEEVDAIFAEIFGADSDESEIAYTLVSASSRAATKATTTTSVTTKSVAF
jgi:hypothetical protein